MFLFKLFSYGSLTFGLAFSQALSADTITGELSFLKKPSFAGVIYVENKGYGVRETTLDQKDKKFTRKMIVTSPGGTLTFKNSDSFEHNIYSNGINNASKFDIGLMVAGVQKKIEVNWVADSVIRVGCKIHPRMKAYIANIESSLFQVIPFEKKKTNYAIKLDGISGDQVKIKLKIPKYTDTEVTLVSGESKTVDVLKKGKKKATLTLHRS